MERGLAPAPASNAGELSATADRSQEPDGRVGAVFDLSPEKIVLIGIIALLVLGPDRLPKAARTLGRTLQQLRSLSGSMQTEMRDAFAEPRQMLNDAVGEMGLPTSIPKIPSVRRSVSQALFAPIEAKDHSAPAAWTDTASREATAPTGSSALPDDPALN
jgi:sec-independent protein translocase protein TatB